MSRSHGQVRVEVDLTSSSSEVGLAGERARGRGLNGRGLEGRGMAVAVEGLWSRGRGRESLGRVEVEVVRSRFRLGTVDRNGGRIQVEAYSERTVEVVFDSSGCWIWIEWKPEVGSRKMKTEDEYGNFESGDGED
ncbi:hypothetical protein CDL15_Pgr001674 [Punica granatum]|uniref:Uncharacterized protein n=1 Tax=Punica granatum TaxID=22663 RepID=A0A218XBL1_PUNGR|nr:hypothetical protein CDL15_Pgr001674 [Punica granatum]